MSTQYSHSYTYDTLDIWRVAKVHLLRMANRSVQSCANSSNHNFPTSLFVVFVFARQVRGSEGLWWGGGIGKVRLLLSCFRFQCLLVR